MRGRMRIRGIREVVLLGALASLVGACGAGVEDDPELSEEPAGEAGDGKADALRALPLEAFVCRASVLPHAPGGPVSLQVQLTAQPGCRGSALGTDVVTFPNPSEPAFRRLRAQAEPQLSAGRRIPDRVGASAWFTPGAVYRRFCGGSSGSTEGYEPIDTVRFTNPHLPPVVDLPGGRHDCTWWETARNTPACRQPRPPAWCTLPSGSSEVCSTAPVTGAVWDFVKCGGVVAATWEIPGLLSLPGALWSGNAQLIITILGVTAVTTFIETIGGFRVLDPCACTASRLISDGRCAIGFARVFRWATDRALDRNNRGICSY